MSKENNFGELKKVPLREIWQNEATDFTPWLEENIQNLGDVLGLDLEIIEREASVGDFSLDLLAEDLGSSRKVIIENQLEQTDHDHLGKLLTYAAGYDAPIVIWISKNVRDEHRQALEWLNQRTDTETQFFAVVVEVLKIDDSKPAFNFKIVVSPNEWQKSNRQTISANTSPKREKYRDYFQKLIDELAGEKYKFTKPCSPYPQNFYEFSPSVSGVKYAVSFRNDGRTRVEVYINLGDKILFDALEERKQEIENSYGSQLSWERLDDKKKSAIAIYRVGTINSSDEELQEIRQWHIENLLKMKEVFNPEIIRQALEETTP